MGDKIFITGGSGFIGSHVVKLLQEKGYAVYSLQRKPRNTHLENNPTTSAATTPVPPVTYIYGDIRDPQCLTTCFTTHKFCGCLHLASISAWKEMRTPALEEIIVGGTKNLLEQLLKYQPTARLLFVSSAAAIAASPTPQIFNEDAPFNLGSYPSLRYAHAKHLAEKLVMEYIDRGLEAVIVNPAEVYGPGDTNLVTAGNLLEILNSRLCLSCRGGTSIAHVDDVARGILQAFLQGRSGQRYILGGDNLTIRELSALILTISQELQQPQKFRLKLQVPNWLLNLVMKICQKLAISPPLPPEIIDYATKFFFLDSSKAQKELNYQTRSAKEVLTPVIAWLYDAHYVRA